MDIGNKLTLSILHVNDNLSLRELKSLMENKAIEILSCSCDKFIDILNDKEKLFNFSDPFNLVFIKPSTINVDKIKNALTKSSKDFRYHLFTDDVLIKNDMLKKFKPLNNFETRVNNNFIGESLFSNLKYSAVLII
jgi:hypothetical protein